MEKMDHPEMKVRSCLYCKHCVYGDERMDSGCCVHADHYLLEVPNIPAAQARAKTCRLYEEDAGRKEMVLESLKGGDV